MIKKKNLTVFVSGNGTNFVAIQNKILKNEINGEIKFLLSSNPLAPAITKSIKFKIPVYVLNIKMFPDKNIFIKTLLHLLKKHKIDFIILAGYLQKVPAEIVKKYYKKIINIHPALLPDFGGKGMYGMKVHKAVIKSGAKFSGITIHYVDENYDTGPIIFQKKIKIKNSESPETLASKIQKLEHKWFPWVIAQICNK